MKGFVKFVTLVVVILMVEVSVLATATWLVVRNIEWGTVDLHDRNEGIRVRVPFPASALNGCMRLGVNHVRLDVDDETDLAVIRAIAGMADDLADAPDMKIVEVRENDATVTIRKKAGKFQIEVREPDADIVITLPQSSVKRFAEAVETVSEEF